MMKDKKNRSIEDTCKADCLSRSGEGARLVIRETLGVVIPIASTLMLLFNPIKNSPYSS